MLVLLLVVVVTVVGTVVVVGLAFAMGKVLVQLLPFTAFEATLLALLGFVVFATVAARSIESALGLPILPADSQLPEEDPEEDDELEQRRTESPPTLVVMPVSAPAPDEAAPRRHRGPRGRRA